MNLKVAALVFLSLALFSCKKPDKLTLKRTGFSVLSGWSMDHKKQALRAFQKSCGKLGSSKKNIEYDRLFDLDKLEKTCKNSYNSNAEEFFRNNFHPYLVKNNSEEEGLFTGYYEIGIKGKRKKGGEYIYPIYKAPPLLKEIKENLTREAIHQGALRGMGLEIGYTNDPIRLFLMHVQGSGKLHLESGAVIKLGYHSQNGHQYTSIGKFLIEEEGLDKEAMSAQTIVDWLEANPDEVLDILNKNESFVFFREYEEDGPIGSQGAAVTPERSLAIDNKFIPYGFPIWLETEYPDGTSLNKLMVAQDSGGAIKGPVRGDVFFGSTKEAEQLAWHMKGIGKYFVLIPK